ncbi:MAG: hypothetical protein HXY35_11990 [Chloroflexi bacterium]|nr:hypothetical protein [Chloroflexota bacterium]
MNKIRSQRGQAIILLAFAIVALVGFAALAIDGGRALSDRRHAQNAADTAAFAAALAKIHGGDFAAMRSAALLRAQSNGYNNGANPNGSTSIVEVNLCSDTGVTCQGLPSGADPSDYVRVRIKSTINTSFARIIGRPQVENTVEAVAYASDITPDPLIFGAALAAFQQDGTPFTGQGNGTLQVVGSGIFSNADTTGCPNGAMKLYGNVNYEVETGYASPGQICEGGSADVDETQFETVPQVPIPNFDIPAPSFTCSGTGQLIGNEYQPGNYNDITIPPAGTRTFAPGNYCISGDVSLKGTVTANNVNFRVGGAFTVNSNSSLNCSNVIIHRVGGSSDVSFNGNSDIHCSNITFYLESGGIGWNGTGEYDFTSPTSGPYKGLLVYIPAGNNQTVTLNGNSGSQYTGSIIAVTSSVNINGNSDTAGFTTQILANDIHFSGNATTVINYDPALVFTPTQYPTIELTK